MAEESQPMHRAPGDERFLGLVHSSRWAARIKPPSALYLHERQDVTIPTNKIHLPSLRGDEVPMEQSVTVPDGYVAPRKAFAEVPELLGCQFLSSATSRLGQI